MARMSVRFGLCRGVLVSALLAATLAGCGASAPSSALPAGAASQMRAQLDRVRTSAASGDPRAANNALDAFAADVAQQRSSGRLYASEFAAIETGIARARHRIAVEGVPPSAPATTTPVTPQPTGPPAATPPGEGKDHGKPKGDGKGKGHGKG